VPFTKIGFVIPIFRFVRRIVIENNHASDLTLHLLSRK